MTTTKLNYEQYLRWNENKGINPKTGRDITIGGPVYLKIEEGWNKIQQSRDYSQYECKEWIGNRLVNPKTRKIIKDSGVTYETIRSICEKYAPIEDIEELAEERLEKESTRRSYACKMLGFCKKGLDYVSDFGCIGQPCMMKECPWRGRLGLNFTILPKGITKTASLFFPFLSDRCCCFCLGHMILFMTLILNSYVMVFAPKDVRDVVKIQNTVNKINGSVDLDKALTDSIRKEANSEIRKVITSGKPVKWLSNLVNIIIPYANDSIYRSIAELQDEVSENSHSIG